MAYKSLREYINKLRDNDELVIIKDFVDPVLEIAEITDRISKAPNGGKALLFENTATEFPVLINSMGSYRRMNMALGLNDLDEPGEEIRQLLKDISFPAAGLRQKLSILPKLGRFSSWMPSLSRAKGSCQEVVHKDPDLGILPVLQCWPKDAGRFFTFPMVHTKDLHTGIRNVGMYRMQVIDRQTTGMHWHRHKVGARHYREYKEAGIRMPVAVALGGDPVFTYAATAPLPDNMDEYMLAGFLRKKKVELVKCLSQDIEVPADADIIIEGYIDPSEELFLEGPFGDHTGFYSLADWYPRFHVTCITHRKDAVYPATIVGIPPQEDVWIAKATERIFLIPLQLSVIPELLDMEIPPEGVAHNLTIVKIRKDYPGQARKVMNALWGAGQMMLNKMLIVVDGDVDIHDYHALAVHISANFDPATDVYFDRGPLDVLDHASVVMGFGGKMGIDATAKLEEELITGVAGQADKRADIQSAKILPLKINAGEIPLISATGVSLLKTGISVQVVAIKKCSSEELWEIAYSLLDKTDAGGPAVLLFVDDRLDIDDISVITWLSTNNIDPQRDCRILKKSRSMLFIDASTKFPGLGEHTRDWPNIIVSDDSTIRTVDAKWSALGLGELIASPSLEYKKYLRKGGAEVEE